MGRKFTTYNNKEFEMTILKFLFLSESTKKFAIGLKGAEFSQFNAVPKGQLQKKKSSQWQQKIPTPKTPRKGWGCVLFLSLEILPFLFSVGSWWQCVPWVRRICISKNRREWSVGCHPSSDPWRGGRGGKWSSITFSWPPPSLSEISTCTAGIAQQLAHSPPSRGSLRAGGPAWAEAGTKSGSLKTGFTKRSVVPAVGGQ